MQAFSRRATAHTELKHFKEAIADWERVLQLENKNKVAKQEILRLQQVCTTPAAVRPTALFTAAACAVPRLALIPRRQLKSAHDELQRATFNPLKAALQMTASSQAAAPHRHERHYVRVPIEEIGTPVASEDEGEEAQGQAPAQAPAQAPPSAVTVAAAVPGPTITMLSPDGVDGDRPASAAPASPSPSEGHTEREQALQTLQRRRHTPAPAAAVSSSTPAPPPASLSLPPPTNSVAFDLAWADCAGRLDQQAALLQVWPWCCPRLPPPHHDRTIFPTLRHARGDRSVACP